MKIILINPPISTVERYGRDIGDIAGHQAPLGLCYLAGFLEKYGFEVSFIDAQAEGLSNREIRKKISSFKPDAVGITSTTVAFHRAKSLATDIKLSKPDIPIIIGGPHVTANPRETLSFKCFDYGVMREGEITLFELLKGLKRNDSLEGLPGVVLRKNGNVIINPQRPYIDDLDSLPFPARHFLPDIKKYVPPLGSYSDTPAVSIITSRGCPYGCIFCDKNVFGRTIRYHSPEYVVSEIKNVITRYGAKEIFFVDDTFTVNEERVRKILFLMQREKIRIKWTCMTRANNITEDLLETMKAAGCWQISIGVESGNQQVLDFIKKGITLGQVRDVVNWSHKLGIYVKGFFIIGHPIDTVKTIDETIDFAKSIPFSDVVVTFATPIAGSELYSMAPKYGLFHGNDWSKLSYWKPVFVPFGLSEKIFYIKQKQFYREFYFRFNVIFRHLRNMRRISQYLKYGVNIVKVLPSLIFTKDKKL
ncbi:MAG: radical SAM protein [Candidatus Omnitrophica bacterium]|nr:radical SAM protein [Candidatus Omnitrophota bacterium]